MAKFEASALHKVNPKLLGSQKKKEFGCNAESPGARANCWKSVPHTCHRGTQVEHSLGVIEKDSMECRWQVGTKHTVTEGVGLESRKQSSGKKFSLSYSFCRYLLMFCPSLPCVGVVQHLI